MYSSTNLDMNANNAASDTEDHADGHFCGWRTEQDIIHQEVSIPHDPQLTHRTRQEQQHQSDPIADLYQMVYVRLASRGGQQFGQVCDR